MLENLVKDYSRPCLIDLKMGRRQFGADSDNDKRKLLENRCAETTSATLGFRICGTQVTRLYFNKSVTILVDRNAFLSKVISQTATTSYNTTIYFMLFRFFGVRSNSHSSF